MPTAQRPNILLLMTDQHRADCLGYAGHPTLQTPFLDELAANGCYFPRAYTACPQCIPARRTLLTGQTPHHHGVYANVGGIPLPEKAPTLPGELAKAGYQTHFCGKIHTYPQRALYGFMSADWSDMFARDDDDDYTEFLRQNGFSLERRQGNPVGNANTWIARPWTDPEYLHPTNWTTDCALRFLRRRDPTRPFFLKVSYYFPHQPCVPPQVFWDRYIDSDLPPPIEANWSAESSAKDASNTVAAWKGHLSRAEMKQFRAGYFGCINHIDEQIGRLLSKIDRDNTLILFVADHGEMLGDHGLFRKTRAFESSARIPFILHAPKSMGLPARETRKEVVELMDLMPTCLEAAGAPIPDTVDGQSLISRLRGESDWRDILHGEQASLGGDPGSGMQYLTDGRFKYIWEPGNAREYFFDLENDPQEMHNLAATPNNNKTIQPWRDRLVSILEGRPEGFVQDGRLQKLPHGTPKHR